MEQTADISHPVRDAFQELGHKASVAATSAYVALPLLMASAPAYGHDTEEAHTHFGGHWVIAGIAAGLAGTVIYKGTNYATRARSPTARFVAHAATIATLSAMALAANYL